LTIFKFFVDLLANLVFSCVEVARA